MVTASKRLMKALSLGDPVCRLDAAKTWAGILEKRQGNHPVESLNRLYLPISRLSHRRAFQKKKAAVLKGASSHLQRTGQEYHSRTDLTHDKVSVELDSCVVG